MLEKSKVCLFKKITMTKNQALWLLWLALISLSFLKISSSLEIQQPYSHSTMEGAERVWSFPNNCYYLTYLELPGNTYSKGLSFSDLRVHSLQTIFLLGNLSKIIINKCLTLQLPEALITVDANKKLTKILKKSSSGE